MAKPRDGFKGRFVELPVGVWDRLDALKEAAGVPLAVLVEDAVTRYCDRPPKTLPAGRAVGRKKADDPPAHS